MPNRPNGAHAREMANCYAQVRSLERELTHARNVISDQADLIALLQAKTKRDA